jgi:hypothetical protein
MESFAINIGDFALSEPVTAISDLLLTLLCLSVCKLLQRMSGKNSAITYWQLFFFGMSLSVLTGVFVHGFRHYQTEEQHYLTWMLMNSITGCSVYFAQLATSRSVLKDTRQGNILRMIAQVQILVYLTCLFFIHSFMVVKIQIAAGMVPVMVIYIMNYRKGGKGGGWIGLGIGLSFFSAVFHTLKLSINERWFNYNDLSHVFITASFIMIAAGVKIYHRNTLNVPVVNK